MEKTYEVTGMKCQGCVTKVTEKLSAVTLQDRKSVV